MQRKDPWVGSWLADEMTPAAAARQGLPAPGSAWRPRIVGAACGRTDLLCARIFIGVGGELLIELGNWSATSEQHAKANFGVAGSQPARTLSGSADDAEDAVAVISSFTHGRRHGFPPPDLNDQATGYAFDRLPRGVCSMTGQRGCSRSR